MTYHHHSSVGRSDVFLKREDQGEKVNVPCWSYIQGNGSDVFSVGSLLIDLASCATKRHITLAIDLDETNVIISICISFVSCLQY